MKKHFLFFTYVLLTVLTTNSCKKSTTGPPQCSLNFEVRFFDNETNALLDLSNTNILNSIKVTTYSFRDEEFSTIGLDLSIYESFDNDIFTFKFISGAYDYCRQNAFSNKKLDRYIISYDDLKSDTIDIGSEKINNKYTISYMLNGAVFDTISSTELFNGDILLPVNIKK